MDAIVAPRTRETVVVSGLGPMCRYGQSRGALAETFGRSARVEFAAPEARNDDWFDPQPHLGKHGYKYHVKASQMLWAATKVALADAGLAEIQDKPSVGVCIGTNFAVHETLRSFDATIRSVGAGALQPMFAPNFSVNLPASVLSLKEGYQALNLTLTNPLVAGLESLIAGANAIADGRAAKVIAGASEDAARDCALLPGGEGLEAAACALVLERAADAAARGASAYASLVGYLQRFYGASGVATPSAQDFLALVGDVALNAAGNGGVAQPLIVSAPGGARPLAHSSVAALVEAARRTGLEVEVRERPPALARLGCAAALLHGAVLLEHERPLVLLECSPYGHLVALAFGPAPREFEIRRAA